MGLEEPEGRSPTTHTGRGLLMWGHSLQLALPSLSQSPATCTLPQDREKRGGQSTAHLEWHLGWMESAEGHLCLT